MTATAATACALDATAPDVQPAVARKAIAAAVGMNHTTTLGALCAALGLLCSAASYERLRTLIPQAHAGRAPGPVGQRPQARPPPRASCAAV